MLRFGLPANTLPQNNEYAIGIVSAQSGECTRPILAGVHYGAAPHPYFGADRSHRT